MPIDPSLSIKEGKKKAAVSFSNMEISRSFQNSCGKLFARESGWLIERGQESVRELHVFHR
jgi:hypothetical protein